MVPISTDSTDPTSPTTSSFNGRRDGSKRAACRTGPLVPYCVIQMGSIRRTSALACRSETPGFSRAIPTYAWTSLGWSWFPSKRCGRITSGSAFRNRNPCGMTPMTSRGRESIVMVRPTAARSPPKRRRQYPWVRITVSVVPAVSSVDENHRPRTGTTPTAGRVPYVTTRVRTSSGSPIPVTFAAPVCHTPNS